MRKTIEKVLCKTLDCKFKKNWIPKGYTCVHIKTFAKELANELAKEKKCP